MCKIFVSLKSSSYLCNIKIRTKSALRSTVKREFMKIITNTLGVKNFNKVDFEDANVVVVMNANDPIISFLKVDEHEDVEDAVKNYLAQTTLGCNYSYKIVKVIGNTYFCN